MIPGTLPKECKLRGTIETIQALKPSFSKFIFYNVLRSHNVEVGCLANEGVKQEGVFVHNGHPSISPIP